MKLIDGFEPFILPSAPECPEPTVLHYVRQAAIEFFTKTNAWKSSLATIDADGVLTRFPLVLPAGAVVSKLLTVRVTPTLQQPNEAELFEADEWQRRIDESSHRLMAATDAARDAVMVWPLQAAGTPIDVRAVLKPAQVATELPDGLFEQYASPIAAGALASILSMPEKTWTDLTTADIKAGVFQQAISSKARVAERGFARSGRRSTTRYF